MTTHKLNSLPKDGKPVRVVGLILDVRKLLTKNKSEEMAKIKLQDFTDEIDVVVSPKLYTTLNGLLNKGNVVIVSGYMSAYMEKTNIVATDIARL